MLRKLLSENIRCFCGEYLFILKYSTANLVVVIQRSDWLSCKVHVYISRLWCAVRIRIMRMTNTWYVTFCIAFMFSFVVCREEEARACSNDQSSEEEEAAQSPETSSTDNVAARADCCGGDTVYFICCWCCLAGEEIRACKLWWQCHQWFRFSRTYSFLLGE